MSIVVGRQGVISIIFVSFSAFHQILDNTFVIHFSFYHLPPSLTKIINTRKQSLHKTGSIHSLHFEKMPLEATMVVIDNSEFSRNGDYAPTRFQAQQDALDVVFHAKVHSNPENTVGLLAGAGEGPQVLSTLTADFGKILSGIHSTHISGQLHFATAIQVAALALKHRQNKVQHQRIVSFVGSPIQESEKELEKLAKKMKKNNIAIDFISYGEEVSNTAKLEKFISIVNSHDNSHLVTVPPGNRSIADAISSSPIILVEGEAAPGGSGGGDFGDFGDFGDAGMDPDLALALRLSLEEEQARQQREQQQQQQQQQQPEQDQQQGDNNDTNMEDAR